MLKIPCLLPKLFLRLNGSKFGKCLKLIGWPFIYKSSRATLRIGDNCRINSNFFSNLLGLYHRTIIIAKGTSNIIIGDNVGISGATIYAWEKIEIDDNTLIGANTKIFDNDFHPIDSEARLCDDLSKVVPKPVKVGKNVFVGCNCIILKGTVIGDNCVIGAGSVVNGIFEDNCIIAGNPARIVRKLQVTDI